MADADQQEMYEYLAGASVAIEEPRVYATDNVKMDMGAPLYRLLQDVADEHKFSLVIFTPSDVEDLNARDGDEYYNIKGMLQAYAQETGLPQGEYDYRRAVDALVRADQKEHSADPLYHGYCTIVAPTDKDNTFNSQNFATRNTMVSDVSVEMATLGLYDGRQVKEFVVLHEVAHCIDSKKRIDAQMAIKNGADPKDVYDEGRLTVDRRESAADIIAIPLTRDLTRLKDDGTAFNLSNFNSLSGYEGVVQRLRAGRILQGFENGDVEHASSHFMEKALGNLHETGVVDADKVLRTYPQGNEQTFKAIDKKVENYLYDTWFEMGGLPGRRYASDELKYAAIKELHEQGHFAEDSAQEAVVRNYLWMAEEYFPGHFQVTSAQTLKDFLAERFEFDNEMIRRDIEDLDQKENRILKDVPEEHRAGYKAVFDQCVAFLAEQWDERSLVSVRGQMFRGLSVGLMTETVKEMRMQGMLQDNPYAQAMATITSEEIESIGYSDKLQTLFKMVDGHRMEIMGENALAPVPVDEQPNPGLQPKM